MSREFRIGASSLRGTYNAGRFIAESPSEAIELARQSYAKSPIGRELKDVNSFRFYVQSDDNSGDSQ